jgi:hypothetical protein
VSIKKLDEKIRFKLAALRFIAVKLNITVPAHLAMIQTVYDIKMNALKSEIKVSLDQFDKKATKQLDQQHSSAQPTATNQINKFLATTTRLLKSYGKIKKRTKSVEAPEQDRQRNQDNQGLRESRKDQSASNKSLAHKNYYLLERDNLERKYENQMRLIQFEILNAINAIEIQFQEIKRQRSEANVDNKDPLNERIKFECKHHGCHCNAGSQADKKRAESTKSRVNYSTQVSLQKRIQSRLNRKKKQQLVISGSRESIVGLETNTGGVKLIRSTDIEKYRNPNSIETMV